MIDGFEPGTFSREVRLGDRLVGAGHPCYVIAEIGVNHNGDEGLGREMVRAAARAGADAVKVQYFHSEALVQAGVAKAGYQERGAAPSADQLAMLRSLELTWEKLAGLGEEARALGVGFIATPFDDGSLEGLLDKDLSALKVSSTDLTNRRFVRRSAAAGTPLIVSTGMSEQSEVELAVRLLAEVSPDVVLLQCTSSYPAPEDELDLRVMERYRQDFGIIVGYSDHTPGIGAAPYAVAAGAVVIEKHLTLDRDAPGPDHRASIEPAEFAEMIAQIRRVESMLGSTVKRVQVCELENRRSLQKSLVWARDVAAGETVTQDCLKAMRCGGAGISASLEDRFIGRVAATDHRAGDLVVG